MSVNVKPSELRAYAAQVRRAGQVATQAKDYAKRYADAVDKPDQQMFVHIFKLAADYMMGKVDALSVRVSSLCSGSATGLEKAAGKYSSTDKTSAGQVAKKSPASAEGRSS